MDSLIGTILKNASTTSCFGEGTTLVTYEENSNKKSGDHFASDVFFYKLHLEKNEKKWSIDVVIKIQPRSERLREFVRTKGQFRNEEFMYKEVLPFLDKDGVVEQLFGKLYCAYVDSGEDYINDYFMFEDLTSQGYRHTSSKTFLDFDHCALAMKHIGMFHALSYAKKHEGCVNQLKTFSKKFILKQTKERLISLTEFYYLCGKRGVDPVIEEGICVEVLTEFLENYDDFSKFYFGLIEPVEPEAVVCHGDFCRNNIFFKYDANGRPVSLKLYDLQTPVYSSPVIDLSFFFFMNTDQKLRDEHWDDLLLIYRNAVRDTVPGIQVPDLDFGRVAVYGYLLSSFFLPSMMKEQEISDVEQRFEQTLHEQAVEAAKCGGAQATRALADIVRHMAQRNYIRSNYR
ncbi:uncharacterized protein LOC120349433 [Nilaparvata lugens]|uniref:uncharacterized protein LOC120349433 n=1 Tax=Nilaparvata lugens TaxID=108931 RepID=UPI00193D5BDD|nr:uncharacterized protein LOC120349433 [Nilaparvata lugens]XP_039275459.1 uncharacterized protein LOC120349433 [Nilaparvata lugens]XP_039275460.1 uncharacterized protein LOC120349433 [Nilaparvata lugens]